MYSYDCRTGNEIYIYMRKTHSLLWKIFSFFHYGISSIQYCICAYIHQMQTPYRSEPVYTVFYAILIFVSLVCFFLTNHFKKHFPDNHRKVMHLQIFFGIFLLIWGACITIYDQRVSENISVYMIISLVVAMVVNFTTMQAILTYGTL